MSDDAPLGPHLFPVGYDLFKHLTTVALIGIGGVLGLLAGEGPRLDRVTVMAVVALLALGGVTGMNGMMLLAQAEEEGGDPAVLRRKVRRHRKVATATVMMGLGVFLGSFTGALTA